MKEYQYHIFAPYRVCPLGAHVDHQHGLVTGFAIDKGVDLWFDVSDDSHVHLESKTFEGIVDFDLDQPSQVREMHWGDYARGAKFALRKRFELKHGINGVIQGSLPVGGLSSSAAVLIAYVMAFAKANDITLQPFEVVKIASEAEREYMQGAPERKNGEDGLPVPPYAVYRWRSAREPAGLCEYPAGGTGACWVA